MSQAAIGDTYTDVLGRYFGGRAWIVRITGVDANRESARRFIRADWSGRSRSGRSGIIRFAVDEPGLYGFRCFCVGSTTCNWEWPGFAVLTAVGVMERSRASGRASSPDNGSPRG